MSKSLELTEKRTNLIGEARNIFNANPVMTKEQDEQYNRIMVDVDALADQIKTEKRSEHQTKLEAELKQSANDQRTAPHRPAYTSVSEKRAFVSWAAKRSGMGSGSECEPYFNAYDQKLSIRLSQDYYDPIEQRAGLLVSGATTGATLVPTLIPKMIDDWLKYFCELRNYVRVERTLTGDPFNMPTSDWTGDNLSNGTTTPEQGTITEVDPVINKVPFSAYKFARLVSISKELVQDNILGDGLLGLIAKGLAQVISRGQEYDFFQGLGSASNEPTGLVVAAKNAGSPVEVVNTLSFDNIMDGIYNVDRIYQKDVAIFCSNNTLNACRKIKDSNGRPLWLDFITPYKDDQQEVISGHKVIVSNSMPDFLAGSGTGLGSVFMVFCPPQEYMIRDVLEFEFEVNPYENMKQQMINFYGTLRTDANYIGAPRSIKYLTC